MIRKLAIFFVGIYLRLFYHHKVYGIDNLPIKGGIVASNHASFLDPPIIGVSCPHEVHFLARESLFHFKPFGWLIRQLYTHPVTKGKENVAAIKKTVEFLVSGKKVVIFPEGTRSMDGKLQKGQAGIGMLVMRTHCLVIPVYVYGTYEIWNATRKYPRLKGKTACVFGSPLEFSKLERGDKREAQIKIVEMIMEAIERLEKWYLAGAKGTPP